ncbi:helix-turn-helix domain-containing protein [Pseudooceanicola sp. 200-1SW]|uniref:helix-turn-helix domain-containing protein n=1 Tax=Pseudooceanicola sp. 200-1SW TaxID=3425949 RepID=UPI003D7F9C11
MVSALHIANILGRARLASELGVGDSAVSNAVSRGRFPASWFFVVNRLALSANIPCPPELFGMRAAEGEPPKGHSSSPELCGSGRQSCPAKTPGEFPHA